MERVKLVYKTESEEEVELPFRILILGDFSNGNNGKELILREPETVTVTNFDDIMNALNIRLQARVPNCFDVTSASVFDIDLKFGALEHFHPDYLLTAVPELNFLLEMKKVLLQARRDGTISAEFLEQFPQISAAQWQKVGVNTAQVDNTTVTIALAEINRILNEQLNAILHCDSFRQLESLWRSVFYLARQNVVGENCEIEILDVSAEELQDDFHNSDEIYDSFLYKIVYLEELGTYGGKPYSVILSDFEFDHSRYSLSFLENCAEVARLSYAPFIAGVSPRLLGIDDISKISVVQDLAELFNRDLKFAGWRRFRESDAARFVGLTLPGFMLRTAYHYRTDQLKKFEFVEDNRPLWGSAAFALGACMLRSFIRYRWYLDIIGQNGGAVPDVSWFENNAVGAQQPVLPLPVVLTERCYDMLSKNGFIPLFYHPDSNELVFHSANSVRSSMFEGIPDEEPTLDSRLANQLPYLYIICRLAHYLKVIQRGNIGASKTVPQLEEELNNWLIQYVSEMDNPTPDVQSRRPLRKAALRFMNQENSTSEVEMELRVTPHFKYMGTSFSLSLQGHL